MIKSNMLAVVLQALFLSSAANAAEIYNKDNNKIDLYGRAVGLHYLSDDKTIKGDQSYLSFGLHSETLIKDQLTGYSQWEYNIQANDLTHSNAKDGNKTRLGVVGMKLQNFGSLDYGKSYGVAYDGLAWTNVLPGFGGDFSLDDTMTSRMAGVTTYRNNDFFGLVKGWDFSVQYQSKNDRGKTPEKIRRSNGVGWGASTSYVSNNGLGLVGAYSKQNRTKSQKSGNFLSQGKTAEVWAAGLKYDTEHLYLAATYAEGRHATPISGVINGQLVSGFANKTKDWEVVAQYQSEIGLKPQVGYVKTQAQDIEGLNGDVDIAKYLKVGASYSINKRMFTYFDYRINQLNDNNAIGLNNNDVVAVGMAYNF